MIIYVGEQSLNSPNVNPCIVFYGKDEQYSVEITLNILILIMLNFDFEVTEMQ